MEFRNRARDAEINAAAADLLTITDSISACLKDFSAELLIAQRSQ